MFRSTTLLLRHCARAATTGQLHNNNNTNARYLSAATTNTVVHRKIQDDRSHSGKERQQRPNITQPSAGAPNASLLSTPPSKVVATPAGTSRIEFENEHHLARALSKNPVSPAQQQRWQKLVKKRTWDLMPFEKHHSPPYEIKALQEIHNRSFDANVLLEIRDVRLPASSHHPSFTRLAKHRLHLVCYTHADMIDAPTRDRVEAWTNKSWPGSRSIFVDTREHRSDLPYDLVYDSLMGYLESSGGINAALTVGVPNTGKSSVLMALIRLARARGNIPKQLKATIHHKKKRRLGKTGPIAILDKPGRTREITEYLLREKPRAFFLDVPGITPPTFFFDERPEAWFGYGAANLMPMSKTLANDVQAQTAFCDYVLYCLNRDGNFHYVPKLGLTKPTDDIEEVLLQVKQGKTYKQDEVQIVLKRCESFLKLFNTGNLGPVILDDISRPYRKFEFNDAHFVKERKTFSDMRAQSRRSRDDFNGDEEYEDNSRDRRRYRDRNDDNDEEEPVDDFKEDDFQF